MKIALYYPWIYTKGGGEKVILELLKRSKHEFKVFCNKYDPEGTFEELKEFDIKTKGNLPIIGELVRGATFGLASMLTKLPLEDYDIFLVATSGIAEFVTFRNHSIPTFAFCHTPLRPLHDPKIRKKKLKEKNPISRAFYEFAMKVYSFFEKKAWKHFDHVIANSQNTKSRILNGGLFPGDKIDVVHPGADLSHFKPSDTYENYFLYPSRFAYYKRQKLAIKAFLKFKKKTDKDFKLILAGGVSERKESYYNKIKKIADKHEDIEIESNVPGEEWVELYENTYAILFTAMNEDWGIIPIEAGACKKPVIAVNEGGPKESVVDGESGFLVEDDPEAISEAMLKLANDKELVEKMGKRGLKESKKYAWDKFVKKIDEIMNKNANRKTN